MEKVTFSNSYDMNLGVTVKVRVYKFFYRVQASLSGLASPENLFEGSVKFALNPDDGRWHLEESSLPDKGAEEFLGRLHNLKWTDWMAGNANKVQSRRQQEREKQLESAKKYTMTIRPATVPLGGVPTETYIGVLTSDDAVKIESTTGSYSYVHFDYISFPSTPYGPEYRVGQSVVFAGMGGIFQDYETSAPVLLDLQGQTMMDHVAAMPTAVYFVGSPNSSAKVTIYCVDNSNVVSSYGTSLQNEKNFFQCSNRFQNLENIVSEKRNVPEVQSKSLQPANDYSTFFPVPKEGTRYEYDNMEGKGIITSTDMITWLSPRKLPALNQNHPANGKNVLTYVAQRNGSLLSTYFGYIDKYGVISCGSMPNSRELSIGAYDNYIIKNPIVVGASWKSGNLVRTIEGFESVTVPAGTFDNCVKIRTTSDKNSESGSFLWLAPKIGNVKLVYYLTIKEGPSPGAEITIQRLLKKMPYQVDAATLASLDPPGAGQP